MYLDLVFYFHSLPIETKIIIMQILFLLFETIYFFWLKKFFKEEEKKIKELYQ